MQAAAARPATLDITNPLTGELVGSVLNTTPDEVHQAVQRARAAQPTWEVRGNRGRARFLRLWADELWRCQEESVALIRRESGKTRAGALIEVNVLDLLLAYYAQHTPHILAPQRRRTLVPLAQYARVYFKPYGVAGFITPWNYPYLNAYLDLVPALAAGNAVVLKPSERTPFTACHVAACAHRAGIPRDVLQVVTGDGSTGAALVEEVDCISFTGGTATGRKVAARAGERLIPASLELGGKAPLIILEDVDLDDAARGTIQAGLENAGQVCVSPERIYVVAPIYERFVERLAYHVAQLQVGPGGDLGVDMGSMMNEREIVRCEQQIADAVGKGARVVVGGRRRPDLGPLFFEPTILADVDHTMDVMREESFGPLLPVMPVADADEAIRLANESVYGLSSSIFGKDLKRAERLARRIVAGDTSVNRAQWVMGSPSLPMGGRRNSGLGRRGGPEGILRFVAPHTVLVDRNWIINRTLTHLDPLLYRVVRLTRPFVRWLPFLRP